MNEIPKAAVEAAAIARYLSIPSGSPAQVTRPKDWTRLSEVEREEYRADRLLHLYLEAACPHLLAAFAEKLLSDEALEALATDLIGSGWDEASAHTVAVELFGTRHPSVDDIDKARAAIALDLREAVEAALASIDSDGGTT